MQRCQWEEEMKSYKARSRSRAYNEESDQRAFSWVRPSHGELFVGQKLTAHYPSLIETQVMHINAAWCFWTSTSPWIEPAPILTDSTDDTVQQRHSIKTRWRPNITFCYEMNNHMKSREPLAKAITSVNWRGSTQGHRNFLITRTRNAWRVVWNTGSLLLSSEGNLIDAYIVNNCDISILRTREFKAEFKAWGQNYCMKAVSPIHRNCILCLADWQIA